MVPFTTRQLRRPGPYCASLWYCKSFLCPALQFSPAPAGPGLEAVSWSRMSHMISSLGGLPLSSFIKPSPPLASAACRHSPTCNVFTCCQTRARKTLPTPQNASAAAARPRSCRCTTSGTAAWTNSITGKTEGHTNDYVLWIVRSRLRRGHFFRPAQDRPPKILRPLGQGASYFNLKLTDDLCHARYVRLQLSLEIHSHVKFDGRPSQAVRVDASNRTTKRRAVICNSILYQLVQCT
jgi:hypothetical protein